MSDRWRAVLNTARTVGLCATGALSLYAAPALSADWLSTSLPWTLSSNGERLGPLPQNVKIPEMAYAYAARSQPLGVFGRTQPAILKVTVRLNSGAASILLTNPDGSKQLSKDIVLQPDGKDTPIYFRVRPSSPEAIIILRNYNAAGRTGEAVIQSAQFIREGDLTNEELAALVAAGLN